MTSIGRSESTSLFIAAVYSPAITYRLVFIV
jgi:hypothetical protein